jgi:Fe-S-cluster-containing dehydrogenase component
MEDLDNNKPEETNKRRNLLKLGIAAMGATIAGAALPKVFSNPDSEETGEKVKVLTSEGKLMEVDSSHVEKFSSCHSPSSMSDARKGIAGKKFVMVIDLARCKKALKCQEACQDHHNLSDQGKYLKVYKMQDAEATAPYWMPKPCLHCDKPPCVKVCPVDATFKRDDGIVLIDNERCIGCRFCMAACPYSSRTFNWEDPKLPSDYAHESSSCGSRKMGTVSKCDFCPEMLVQGKLPHCVPACPNGVFYFGDKNEDVVTNGDETVRFSQLMIDKGGYRYLEGLGTEPSVYYLPAVNRLFPFKDDEQEGQNS